MLLNKDAADDVAVAADGAGACAAVCSGVGAAVCSGGAGGDDDDDDDDKDDNIDLHVATFSHTIDGLSLSPAALNPFKFTITSFPETSFDAEYRNLKSVQL